MIRVNNSQEEEPEIPINRATKRDCELEIETLQNAPYTSQSCPNLSKGGGEKEEEEFHENGQNM
jgi:hypothetical protein